MSNETESRESEVNKLKSTVKALQLQIEQERKRMAEYGLVISAALRGDTSKKEQPNDGRMQAVRDLKAENERLRKEVEKLNGDVNFIKRWSGFKGAIAEVRAATKAVND